MDDKTQNTPRRPLSLKKGTGSVIRQNVAGRRAKPVVVETKSKKKRLISETQLSSSASESVPSSPMDEISQTAKKLGLSREEYLKRQRALDAAQKIQLNREEEHRREEKARARRMEEERVALEARLKAEEEAELQRLHSEEEKRLREAAEAARHAPSPAQKILAEDDNSFEATLEKAGGRVKKKRVTSPLNRTQKSDSRRRQGKLTIVSALAGDDERQRSLASMRRARERERQKQAGGVQREKVTREVIVPDVISVANLANRMSERGADVVKYLMKQGSMVTLNDVLDADTAQLIVEDFGHVVKRVTESNVEENFLQEDLSEDEALLVPRPPVIAVMGHVDHGKTSLLDALRVTDVTSGETGGITQHIGASQIKLTSGALITVLDTPGHAAFSAMRARGAQAVDIVILVIAADDGIMPQTVESIEQAKAAKTAIIVALTKIDKPEVNPDKIETDLLQYDLITEKMSGEIQVVQVSATEKTGLTDLIEAILLQADLLDLKANPKRKADGVVIESQIQKGRGPVATLLVKRGTLRRGDIVVAGEYWGRIKALMDECTTQLGTAGPSIPVQVMGLDGAPLPGEPFAVVESESRAREITAYRQRKSKENAMIGPSTTSSMEQMMSRLKDKSIDELTVLVKTDVQGSAEAIKSAIERLGTDEIKARVIYSAAGGISESDILLAQSSDAPVLAFNVRPNRQAKELAEHEGVEIRYYSIIYDLMDDVKAAMEGLLSPEKRETFIGYADVLEVFSISKLGKVAGVRVSEGRVERGAGVRLLRDDVVMFEGEISTLKRFKQEVEKVQAGMECGIGLAGYDDLRKGDRIECFTVEFLKRVLKS